MHTNLAWSDPLNIALQISWNCTAIGMTTFFSARICPPPMLSFTDDTREVASGEIGLGPESLPVAIRKGRDVCKFSGVVDDGIVLLFPLPESNGGGGRRAVTGDALGDEWDFGVIARLVDILSLNESVGLLSCSFTSPPDESMLGIRGGREGQGERDEIAGTEILAGSSFAEESALKEPVVEGIRGAATGCRIASMSISEGWWATGRGNLIAGTELSLKCTCRCRCTCTHRINKTKINTNVIHLLPSYAMQWLTLNCRRTT